MVVIFLSEALSLRVDIPQSPWLMGCTVPDQWLPS